MTLASSPSPADLVELAQYYGGVDDETVLGDVTDRHSLVITDLRRAAVLRLEGKDTPPKAFPLLEREAVVGRGSYGRVSRHWSPLHGRDLAVKFPLATACSPAFHYEMDVACAGARRRVRDLQLPGISTYRGSGSIQVTTVECHDFVDGVELGSFLEQNSLSHAIKIDLACQLMEGLHAFHERGLIYRDLKMNNVIVEQDSNGTATAKIVDLGTLIDLETYLRKPNFNEQAIGAFPPPEAFDSSRCETNETFIKRFRAYDAYSLGILLANLFDCIIWVPTGNGNAITFKQMHAKYRKKSPMLGSILNSVMACGSEFYVFPPDDLPDTLKYVIAELVRLRWQERMGVEEGLRILRNLK